LIYAAGAAPRSTQLRRFIILCPPRSGSELLVSLLDAHPRVRCEGELFYPPLYLFRYLEGRARLASIRGKRAFGAKLVFQQLQWWTTASVPGSPGAARRSGGPQGFLRRLHNTGYIFIVLDRRNLLLQALSIVHAQHNEFHYRPGRLAQFEPFLVDPAEVLTLVYMLDHYSAWTRQVLEGLPYAELWYEDDLSQTDRQQATVRRLFARLGVDDACVQPAMIKISPNNARDRVLNYEDLETTFASTRFARLLDP
jgi:LPS sulfotransferase NodH